MAVDSPHLNLYSPQILSNREMNEEGNGNNNVYGNGVKFGMMENGMVNPMCVSSMMMMMDVIPPPSDSGLTFSFPATRKRSRDASSVLSFQNGQAVNCNHHVINNNQNETFAFLGHDVSMQMYHQQVEIDRFIANHMEKVRLQLETTRRRNTMRLIAAAEEGIKKKLRSKEEEIAKIGKLNHTLEEKIKSLNIESQIWQQMAQTNEATANVLQRNLQQTLTQIQHQQQHQLEQQVRAHEDVESCCGSNYENELFPQQESKLLVVGNNDGEINFTTNNTKKDNNGSRWCRNCGKRELSVLLLPCRHLCICTLCESSINFCPICKSAKNASLHVNMS